MIPQSLVPEGEMTMITVVGLTPSLDRTLRLERLAVGGTNRPLRCDDAAGGKGLNVSLLLKALGCAVHLITPSFASGMEPVLKALEEADVPCSAIPVPGALRVNMKLMDLSASTVTEINMPSVLGSAQAPQAFLDAIAAQARTSSWLVLTGSLPRDFPPDFYARAIAAARAEAPACRILLDTEGEPLRLGLAGKPDMIKPNRHELELLCGHPLPTRADIAGEAIRLIRDGVGIVLVSMDVEGSLLASGNELLCAEAVPVPIFTTVGAGDSLVAGFLSVLEAQPQALEAALRMGVACATAHVAGCGAQTDVYLPRIRIRSGLE